MKWAVALLLVTTSCGPLPRSKQEQNYQNAVVTFRHGELTRALAEARSESKRASPDSEFFWKFRLLEAEILRYQGNPAAAAKILAETVPDKPSFANIEARRRMLLSSLPASQSKEQKRKLIEDALRQASVSGDTDLLLEVEIMKGYLLSADDPEEARRIFLDSGRRSVESNDSFHEAVALNDLGMLSIQKSRFDEAIPWFSQALEPAKRALTRPLIATALYNLAICYNQLGAHDDAEARLREALDWFGSGEVKAVRRDLLASMAKTYEFGGNESKAVEYYRQALELAQQTQGSVKVRSRLTGNLCSAQAAAGAWDAAQQTNQAELALASDPRAQGYARLNAAAIASGRGLFTEAVSDYTAAIEAASREPAVLWESYAGLGRAYSQLGRDALAAQNFEKALRVIEENRAGLSRDEYKISFLARLISFYQDYVESLMRAGAYEKALEVADSSRARILVERLGLDTVPRHYGASTYQAYARKLKLVLISYWLAPKQSYAWAISGKGNRWFRLPPAGEIGPLVEQYQAFIEKSVRDPLAVENLPGRRLYELLLSPMASVFPRGTRVVLMPDGPLHRMNFETLPIYDQNPHYWIEDVTISIAPSLSILMMSPPAPQKRSRSLLLMGGALYTGATYQPLRYSSLEVEKIRRRFDASEETVLTGAAANPEAFREADPQRFSIIHFSAHGEANRQSPLDSAIVLSAKDGRFKLYAHDIMRTPLEADLVTISACRGAGSRAYAGEGMVGLAWAFLRSGARNTIAGLWDVDDASTPGMMDAVYASMEAGKSPVEALRLAKLAMVHSKDAYRKPYYWGPFQIYGR